MTPLQQQAQRVADNIQASKRRDSQQAEKARPQTPARQPKADTPNQPTAKLLDRGGRNASEQGDKPRRSATRERSASSADTPSLKRALQSEPAPQEASLFSELLGSDSQTPLAPGGAHFDWTAGMPSAPAQAASAAAPSMALWHQLEPPLSEALARQPGGPVSMTLLLPKLGEVDARMSSLPAGAGWDISLRFAPEALAMLAPHHERCRESLRRRMACRVRLRFEQRGEG
ncbi:type III secretion system HrpP C-terminal domain-containing protein [Erwiniaceae bacterium BAC15a-03b]|uniref:Type III secretion system HrpP C-terminal domain-containing protein n=1 Tax=Winslowiella arboricola TaxID=2978220 RepID=A0A9J6PS69_9GAMM|nr:type III secretion system HrpP C-terminal domain-containing protein [Winslowiella arboricola]MCU5773677.1 type III secretion system HrpP C-terminal domain-containing protein [Winslowiella arboricola]MCU5778424.1 type III secretion system HrpP C-terminal domain-containing protein [Winslowiella arboricola]